NNLTRRASRSVCCARRNDCCARDNRSPARGSKRLCAAEARRLHGGAHLREPTMDMRRNERGSDSRKALNVCRTLAAAVLIARAGAALAATGAVNDFYGSFNTEVAIEAPRYHGLEPN